MCSTIQEFYLENGYLYSLCLEYKMNERGYQGMNSNCGDLESHTKGFGFYSVDDRILLKDLDPT